MSFVFKEPCCPLSVSCPIESGPELSRVLIERNPYILGAVAFQPLACHRLKTSSLMFARDRRRFEYWAFISRTFGRDRT